MRRFLGYMVVYLLCGLLIFPPLYILIVTSWQDDLYELLLGPLSVIPYWLWVVPIGAGAAILAWSCTRAGERRITRQSSGPEPRV